MSKNAILAEGVQIAENKFKAVLSVLASYGIVQVLAQDLGIKTGKKQRDLVQKQPIQFLILYSGAYVVCDDLKLALIATLLYYFLKYVYSNGETSDVCFEDV